MATDPARFPYERRLGALTRAYRDAQRILSGQDIAARLHHIALRAVADVTAAKPGRDIADIGKGQAALPGVIEAQKIGQVGAIGLETQALWIAGAERVGGVSQAPIHRAAIAGA